jgi:hypothetical protein
MLMSSQTPASHFGAGFFGFSGNKDREGLREGKSSHRLRARRHSTTITHKEGQNGGEDQEDLVLWYGCS